MSTSHLISHRLFVSALAQDQLPPAFEEAGGEDPSDGDKVVAVQVEVMPRREYSQGRQAREAAFHRQYDW
jgi:hypothetical protein